MNIQSTHAEQMAKQSEELRSFQGINLNHIKTQVQLMLQLIGRSNLFDQYTVHSIEHVNEMLRITDWLIPDVSKTKMTKADWLLLVLSIYFHDLGMVVTNEEFDNRGSNVAFMKYKENILNNPALSDFKTKVLNLEDGGDKFLFQEFVRSTHATRIGNWIEGKFTSSNQGEASIINEINNLLGNLSQMFREDLALICRSHELDDLDDFDKYKTKVRYGNNPDEAANIHYISVILRTADLLHITSDRTPSIQFSLINPSDPFSVREWQKQMAITAVQPKDSIDENGNIDPNLEKNTIEITGYFAQPELADAFFSLRSYIEYAKIQIRNSYEIIQKSKEKFGTNGYEFPWNDIYDGDITTKGFETKKLQFEIDKENILKLLVGNTLYNDSSVVIRELIQNSLDAIKLQQKLLQDDESEESLEGKVELEWNSNDRTLTIVDNGTGMSLSDINDYLLKVGTSKYRSSDFIKRHPNFHSISRFGIGILTCFMIAEDIDIMTSVKNSNSFNAISIRKISGKYLLKNDDKSKCDNRILNHGTIITLKVRHDIKMNDLLNESKRWVVAPTIPIFLTIDHRRIRLGSDSIKDSIMNYLAENHIRVDGKTYDVFYFCIDQIEYAYAAKYSDFLKEWSFVTTDFLESSLKPPPIGICIEGIRVQFESPGLNGQNILALVNAFGASEIQTNVARTAIESNDAQRKLYMGIYNVYSKHIETQIKALADAGCSSVTFASEAQYLAEPLFTDARYGRHFINNSLLEDSLFDIKCIDVEFDNHHELMSAKDLQHMDDIIIIDSHLIRRVSLFLQDSLTQRTPAEVINFIGIDLGLNSKIPVLCNYSNTNIFHKAVIAQKQVSEIQVNKQQRQVHLNFSKGNFWSTYKLTESRRGTRLDQNGLLNYLHVPSCEIPISGLDLQESGLVTFNGVYLDANKALYKSISKIIDKFDVKNKKDEYLQEAILSIILNCIVYHESNFNTYDERELTSEMNNFYMRVFHCDLDSDLWSLVSKSELSEIVFEHQHQLYNPLGWTRLRGRMYDY